MTTKTIYDFFKPLEKEKEEDQEPDFVEYHRPEIKKSALHNFFQGDDTEPVSASIETTPDTTPPALPSPIEPALFEPTGDKEVDHLLSNVYRPKIALEAQVPQTELSLIKQPGEPYITPEFQQEVFQLSEMTGKATKKAMHLIRSTALEKPDEEMRVLEDTFINQFSKGITEAFFRATPEEQSDPESFSGKAGKFAGMSFEQVAELFTISKIFQPGTFNFFKTLATQAGIDRVILNEAPTDMALNYFKNDLPRAALTAGVFNFAKQTSLPLSEAAIKYAQPLAKLIAKTGGENLASMSQQQVVAVTDKALKAMGYLYKASLAGTTEFIGLKAMGVPTDEAVQDAVATGIFAGFQGKSYKGSSFEKPALKAGLQGKPSQLSAGTGIQRARTAVLKRIEQELVIAKVAVDERKVLQLEKEKVKLEKERVEEQTEKEEAIPLEGTVAEKPQKEIQAAERPGTGIKMPEGITEIKDEALKAKIRERAKTSVEGPTVSKPVAEKKVADFFKSALPGEYEAEQAEQAERETQRLKKEAALTEIEKKYKPEQEAKSSLFPEKEMVSPGQTIGFNYDFSPQAVQESRGKYAERTKKWAKEVSAIDLPELIEISKAITGKVPTVQKKFRKSGKSGEYVPAYSLIRVLASLAEEPEQALKVISHEIGHAVDVAPEKFLKKGNILGRIANLRGYMKTLLEEYPDAPGKVLTDKDRSRLRAAATKWAKKQAGRAVEVETEVPVYAETGLTPEDVKNIWNSITGKEDTPELYNFIKNLSAAEKESIIKEAMDGIVSEKLQAVKGKQVGTKIEKKTIYPSEVFSPEFIKKRYRELLKQEIEKRRLFEKEVIMKELKELSALWRPFDELENWNYTEYRARPEELYADAVSVLFQEPGLLKNKAPTFFKAFFNYIERKPEFKNIYSSILERKKSGRDEVLKKNLAEVYEGQARGEEVLRKAEKKQTERSPKHTALQELRYLFENKNRILYDLLKKKPSEQLRTKIAELKYLHSETFSIMREIDNDITKPLEKENISVKDIGAYMELRRDAFERADKFNPHGIDEATAKEMLDKKMFFEPEKFDFLEKKVQEYWEHRKKIIKKIEDASVFSPSQIKMMKDNEYYATFNVAKYIEDIYGSGVGATLFRQYGTFQDITNPYVSTILKDGLMLRAAQRSATAKALVDYLEKEFAKEAMIFKADKRWVNDKWEFLPANKIKNKKNFPKDFDWREYEEVTFNYEGTPQSYYVDKYIAHIFNHKPSEIQAVLKGLLIATRALKELFVSKNPSWIIRNVFRDVHRNAINIPEANMISSVLEALKVAPEAIDDVWNNISRPLTKELYEKKVLSTKRVFSSKAITDEESSYTREYLKFAMLEKKDKNVIWKALDALEKMGMTGERIAKLAGAKQMKQAKKDLTPDDYMFLRESIGSPDFLAGGDLRIWYNNVWIFSNPQIQGHAGDYRAYKKNKKRWLFKMFLSGVAPAVIVALAEKGFFGDELKDTFEKMGTYDKANYYCLPLGQTPEGKTKHLRLPMHPLAQIVHSITYNALSSAESEAGIKAVFGDILRFNPYMGSHPLFEVPAAWVQVLKGQNPEDRWYGGKVLSRAEHAAGLKGSIKPMLKFTWNKLGGRLFYEIPYRATKPRTKMARLMRLPVVGSFIRSFYREADYGLDQKARRTEKKEKKNKAWKSLQVEKLIEKDIEKITAGEMTRVAVRKRAEDLFNQVVEKKLLDRKISGTEARFKNKYVAAALRLHGDIAAIRTLPKTKSGRKKAFRILSRQK